MKEKRTESWARNQRRRQRIYKVDYGSKGQKKTLRIFFLIIFLAFIIVSIYSIIWYLIK